MSRAVFGWNLKPCPFVAHDQPANETLSGTGLSAEAVALAYDAAGRLTTLTRYSNLSETQTVATTTYGYDHANQVTSITDQNASGTTLVSYGYTYDAAGRLTQEAHTWASGASTDTVSYTYTNNNQLTGVTHTNPAFASENFAYDANGNQTSAGYTTAAGNEQGDVWGHPLSVRIPIYMSERDDPCSLALPHKWLPFGKWVALRPERNPSLINSPARTSSASMMAALSPASSPGMIWVDLGATIRSHGGDEAMKVLTSSDRFGESSSRATCVGIRISLNRAGRIPTHPILTRTTKGELSPTTIIGAPVREPP